MRLIYWLTIGAFAVMLLAGCGGSGEEESLTPPTTEAASTSGSTRATSSTEEAPAEPDQDPGDFIRTHIERSVKGQYGRVWESMHPDHKAVAPRSRWSRCESEQNDDDEGYELAGVDVLEVYDEPLQIPGQSGEVDSKAITVKISVSHPVLEDPVSVTDTVHAVAVDGEWTWILTPSDYEAFAKGQCPPDEGE